MLFMKQIYWEILGMVIDRINRFVTWDEERLSRACNLFSTLSRVEVQIRVRLLIDLFNPDRILLLYSGVNCPCNF